MPAPVKMQWMPQQGELPPPSFSPTDPGLVLTLQLLPLLLSFSLRKAEFCPFNLTHRVLEGGQPGVEGWEMWVLGQRAG